MEYTQLKSLHVGAVTLSLGLFALRIAQAPLRDAWLTAKVIGLLAYIALGTIALKRGRSAAVRQSAFAAALCTFAYIVSVALTKRVLPWA